MQSSWDEKFLGLAEYVSKWSKDPSTKVGAVVVREDNSVAGVGYNGFAMGLNDSEERLNNRDIKYKMIIHGEINAIVLSKESVKGCTLYTWPFMPCCACASFVIQNKIKKVVAPYSDNPRWIESFKISEQLFKEAGVELVLVGKQKPQRQLEFDFKED